MHSLTKVWSSGCLATAATAASAVFNAILAVNTTSNSRIVLSLRVLLFVDLGFSFLGALSLLYYTIFFVKNVKKQYLFVKSAVWSVFGFGVAVGCSAVILSLVTLVWLITVPQDLSPRILGQAPIVWIAIWFACWGLSVVFQLMLFVVLGAWIKRNPRPQSSGRLDIDFGTRIPTTPSLHGMTMTGPRSLYSRDTTIADLPRTPPKQRLSSAAKENVPANVPALVTTTSRTRLVSVSSSAKSSLDMPFPAGEARCVDNAFDRWDTSSVHDEIRAAVGAPPVSCGGLETIPGSRPESPEDVIDSQIMPASSSPPQARSSSPQAITSDTALALGDWSSSPSRYVPTSSPPSSPPNFSRPTSKQKNQPLIASFEASMQEIIHPLFRASSPHPPPIATAGTMVTASPLANQPITPRTLATLRNHNRSSSTVNMTQPKPTGHWRAMPSMSHAGDHRPSTAGSVGPGSPPPGSPGPSIADEDELPPILPGFVLSAGQRSSMVGYANRKSVKQNRRGSSLSEGLI